MFIVQLYLFKEMYHVNMFFFFLLMHSLYCYNVTQKGENQKALVNRKKDIWLKTKILKEIFKH